jgi:predicted HicB family RNase H-like nuclease
MGKKRMGRPPKRPEDKLEARFLLQMTAAEKADAEAKAKAAKVSLTTWIREKIRRAKK